MIDLTKLILSSSSPGFKNNNTYTGSFTVSGSYNGTSKIVTKTITLPAGTDNVDIVFRGRANGGTTPSTGDPRPNSAWFKRGTVYVRATGSGYTNYPMGFQVGASISGRTLTLTASSFRQFTGSLTLTPETVYYRIVDYSVF